MFRTVLMVMLSPFDLMGQERASKPCADCLRLGIVDRVAFLLTAVLYVSGSPVYSSTDQSLFKV